MRSCDVSSSFYVVKESFFIHAVFRFPTHRQTNKLTHALTDDAHYGTEDYGSVDCGTVDYGNGTVDYVGVSFPHLIRGLCRGRLFCRLSDRPPSGRPSSHLFCRLFCRLLCGRGRLSGGPGYRPGRGPRAPRGRPSLASRRRLCPRPCSDSHPCGRPYRRTCCPGGPFRGRRGRRRSGIGGGIRVRRGRGSALSPRILEMKHPEREKEIA